MVSRLAFAINLAHVGIGTIVSVAITLGLWLSRVLRNRQLGAIRTKLRDLGIVERPTVEALLEEGAADNEGILSEGGRRNPLTVEEIRGNVRDALVELVQEADVPDRGGFWDKCARPFFAFYRSLYPFSVTSEDRGTLEKYAQFINAILAPKNPARRAGETIAAGKEHVQLERLLEITAWGEIWRAFVERSSGARRPRPPQYRTVCFYTEENIRNQILLNEEDLWKELTRLAELEGVLRCYHLGGVDENKPYVVTEFVDGISLQNWLLASEDQRPHLDARKVIHELIAALAAAHQQGVFHCRLDPKKVLLEMKHEPGKQAEIMQARIAEFCLSRMTQKRPAPMYAPPDTDAVDEQEKEQLTAGHDIFALGVIWYQLLMDAELERPPYDFYKRLNDYPREIRDRVEKCLAHPDSRWKNAGELLHHIEGGGGPGPDPDPDVVPPPPLTDGFDVTDLLGNFLKTLPRKAARA